MSHLETFQFDDARDHFIKSLGVVSDAVRTGVQGLQNSHEVKIQSLLTDWAQIEDLASTEHQRREYGVDRWDVEWTRLRDVPYDERFRKLLGKNPSDAERNIVRQRLWSQVGNGLFKRFQEVFCRPENRIVPAFEVDGRGKATFQKKMLWEHMPLPPCLVSPDRLSDDHAESLHLCSFTDDDTPRSRLEKKHAAIPVLKLLFESARPLVQHNHRMLVIDQPNEQLLLDYHHVPLPDPAVLGGMLYFRAMPNGNDNGRRGTMLVSHFASAYGAARKTNHEHAKYREEAEQLGAVRTDVKTFNKRLDDEWRAGVDEDTKKSLCKDAQKILLDTAAIFEESKHPMKQRAKKMLAEASQLLLFEEKTQVSGAMSKLVAALNCLKFRGGDIRRKDRYNTEDQLALVEELAAEERALKLFRTGLQTKPELLESKHLAVFGDTLSDGQRKSNVRGMCRAMGVDLSLLDGVRLAPLRGYAERMRSYGEALKHALIEGDQAAAIRARTGMHVTGKFQAAHTCIERMREMLVEGEAPLQKLQEYCEKLREILDARELHSGVTLQEVEQPYIHLTERIACIEQAIGLVLEHPTSADVLQTFRNALQAVRPDELLFQSGKRDA